MAEGPYSVVFKGVAQGRRPDEVKRNLGAIYKKKPQMVDTFFKGKPVVIKKGVDQATALKYKKMFEQAGAVCGISSGQKRAPGAPPAKRPAPPRPAPVRKPAPKPALPMMICPKCGHKQAESPDCINCGIIIARYLQKNQPEPEPTPALGPEEEPGGRPVHPAEAGAGMIYEESMGESVNFFVSLPGVFIYPFVGKGIWILFTGIFTLTIMTLMDFILLVGTGVKYFIWAYFWAYAVKIVNSSADAEKEPPHWPDVTNFMSDIGGPLFRVIGVGIICYLPAVIYGGWVVRSLVESGDINNLFNFSETPSLEVIIFFGLILAGSAYYPMAILATSMSGRLISANPLTIIPSIFKTFIDYFICLIVFLIVVFIRAFAERVMVLPIPLLGAAIYNALALYFIMVEMRLLGLLYNANADRLNWFGEY